MNYSVISDGDASKGPGRKSDIWMFGVFTMEMLAYPELPGYFNEYPRPEHQYNFMNKLANKDINLLDYVDKSCDPGIKEVLEGCLKYNQVERIDSKELVQLCRNLSQ